MAHHHLGNMAYTDQQIESMAGQMKAKGADSTTIYSFIKQAKAEQGAQSQQSQRATPTMSFDQPKQPGFVQNMVQGITQPFIKAGETIAGPVEVAARTAGGMAGGLPFGQAATSALEQQQSSKDLGYFGKVAPIQSPKELAGTGLELAANLPFGGGAATVGKGLAKGMVGTAIKKGAVAGAKTGALFGAGAGMANAPQGVIPTATQTALGAAGGGVAGGLLGATGAGVGGVAGVLGQIKKGEPIIDQLKGAVSNSVKTAITNDVDNLLKATRSISGKTQQAAQKNVDLQKILSDPQVFKGIKVEKAKIVPDEAVATVDNRIDKLLTAKRAMLPEIDRLVPEVSRDTIRNAAVDDIRGKFSPADERVLMKKIDQQINALPATLKPSQIDTLRAQFRKSARDAKGMMKSTSEYAALENSARNTMFDITDNLPVQNAQEYKAINDYIRQMITTKDFLDKTLRNQVVKGGRLKGYAMQVVGTVAGASHGILGALAGSEIGGVVADVLTNNALGSSLKMQLIRGLTDDPAILTQAEKLVGQLKAKTFPLLPAPSGKTPIELPSKGILESQSKIRQISLPKK